MNNKWHVILLVLLLTGCEVIPKDEQLIPLDTKQGTRRHVLIEYTGFRCVNCPTAAEMAQELAETYKEQLYVVSLHPASNPFTQGKYDYTCPAADSIYRWMGGDASTPFPMGNIDLKPYNGEWFIDPHEWATAVYMAMKDSIAPMPDAKMNVTYWLIEDSVKGAQAMPDNSVNMEYYHRHVLRAVANEEYFDIQTGWDSTHLSIMKILSDPIDNHILQVYEKKFTDYSALPADSQ